MEHVEEHLLVEQAKHDPEAFGRLYRRYVDRIYNYHYRHTGNHSDAEDLTSRTFYRALRGIGRYRYRGISFQAWLFRIAHNLMANLHRDRSRKPSVPLDGVSLPGSQLHDPHNHVEASEAQDRLLAVIDRLPEDRKTLLTLKFVEQMSNAEIGAVLGKTEGAVKALYHRTLIGLRQVLIEGGEE
ncbi:MAG: sigma-70 family RNA polymerase sigma factor [Anaerolineae bacterium]|nr:sigma-70 family RNA polymerase sigma factor [Anaerolineae bacterium]